MSWIDGHLDLAYLAVRGRDLRQPIADPAAGCVNLPALRSAGVNVAFATIFTELGVDPATQPHGFLTSDDVDDAERAGMQQLEIYESLEAEGELTIVRTLADLDRPAPLPRIVILMEGADPIRSPDHVAEWARRGVRLVGLTWALGSRYAGGNARPGPLSALGREMVRALDAAGIVHDASHLADEALEGVLALARGRIVATHSNCRALLKENQRHLRDDQIKAIAARDGIVGLNLYSTFLATDRRATVDDCVRHVGHVAKMFGHRRGVALGSDMDGGFGPEKLPEGVDEPGKLGALTAGLEEIGWATGEREAFASGNWDRFLREVLPRD
jgi:membrane dipeptidase